jgi:hypothetical protein
MAADSTADSSEEQARERLQDIRVTADREVRQTLARLLDREDVLDAAQLTAAAEVLLAAVGVAERVQALSGGHAAPADRPDDVGPGGARRPVVLSVVGQPGLAELLSPPRRSALTA